MSNKLLDSSWPLQMAPTPKSVLICMADMADDRGECWPSIPFLCLRTCFSERAVHGAIKWLESAGIVHADRSNGRHTRYYVTPEKYTEPPQEMRPRSKCAPAVDAVEPPQQLREPPQEMRSPPQEMRSNHQEPSITPKKATINRATRREPVDLPNWISADLWADWVAHRKAIKNAMTAKAAELSIAKLADYREQGFSPGLVINTAIERGWRGLYVGGLKPDLKPETSNGKPSAAANFRGKSYESTPLDQLPPDLRAAALAALGDDG